MSVGTRISRRNFIHLTGITALSAAIPGFARALPDLTLQLDWRLNAQFAGPLIADHLGLFTANNINVDIRPWRSGLSVTDEVAGNYRTVGCAEQNLVLAAQADGAPVRAIATMFQASPLALMTLPKNEVTQLQDLSGQQVGVHIDGLKVMQLVQGADMISGEPITVTQIPYENKFDRLLNNEFQAIQCYAVDEPINFAATTGITPDVLPLSNYGYDAYAQVIFAHEQLIREQPEQLKALLTAIFEGWSRAVEDIPATADIIVSRYAAKDSKYQDLDYQTRSLEAVEAFLFRGIKPDQIGEIDPERWQRMSRLFAQYGIIEKAPELISSLDTHFWP